MEVILVDDWLSTLTPGFVLIMCDSWIVDDFLLACCFLLSAISALFVLFLRVERGTAAWFSSSSRMLSMAVSLLFFEVSFFRKWPL